MQLVNLDYGAAANTVTIALEGFAPAAAADLWVIAEPVAPGSAVGSGAMGFAGRTQGSLIVNAPSVAAGATG